MTTHRVSGCRDLLDSVVQVSAVSLPTAQRPRNQGSAAPPSTGQLPEHYEGERAFLASVVI